MAKLCRMLKKENIRFYITLFFFSIFSSFFRAIRFAPQNIWRNFWLSVITVTMLVLTLLSVNLLLVMDFVTSRATQYVEDRIEVSVYFKAGTPQEKAMNALAYLRNLSQVR